MGAYPYGRFGITRITVGFALAMLSQGISAWLLYCTPSVNDVNAIIFLYGGSTPLFGTASSSSDRFSRALLLISKRGNILILECGT